MAFFTIFPLAPEAQGPGLVGDALGKVFLTWTDATNREAGRVYVLKRKRVRVEMRR